MHSLPILYPPFLKIGAKFGTSVRTSSTLVGGDYCTCNRRDVKDGNSCAFRTVNLGTKLTVNFVVHGKVKFMARINVRISSVELYIRLSASTSQ